MNSNLQHVAATAGRAMLALIFIISGWGKITGFAGTAGYIASKGLPLPEVMTAGAIAVEFLGGMALLAGFKARWAALAIFVFIIPTTLFFHNPAGLSGPEAQGQMIHLMKNVAIMGGMLMVFAFGPGRYSVDGE
ncbi:MAG: DoxX family protein [Betaproteobacteria bacterium]